MPTYHSGRHELGQNFLTDRRTITAILDLVARTEGPILEIGAGDGALTLPLQALNRPLTAVEVSPRNVHRLRRRLSPETAVVQADFLRYRLPSTPHALVGNLPFDQTTAMLRRILHAERWTSAVLLVQWEVARRRAAVGGATMMTAQWWPWYEFELAARVPASAFTPPPGVDGGLFTITRRAVPLVDPGLRSRYAGFVHAVFTGRGHGLHQILMRVVSGPERVAARRWLAGQGFRGVPLPRDLSAAQWAELFDIVGSASVRGGGKRSGRR